jgi:glycosyltransferase involved in cell wall biosynthesis
VVYLWRPEYADALTTVPHDASVYHIDDEYSFAPVEQELDAREAAVIAAVDQVFVHSRALLQKKGHLNPQTLYVPNGVDYAAYAARQDEPIDLRAISHPRIGYVGKIKTQMDFPLLLSLAKRHRQWSWVFVGPIGFLGEDASRCEELFRLENVFYLGAKPIPSLPAYTQHIDVCLLCYVANDYTKYIYPLKLHEYLAGGRPVVGTTLPALEEFRSAVRLCTTDDEWSAAIADALAPEANRPQQVELRRTIARSHDWGLLVSRIARSLCERLGADYIRRFDQLSPITGLRDDSYPPTVH